MSAVLYLPMDAAAMSVGAEAVATVLGQELVVRGIEARLVRNGSRGMLWLEPLLEVETPRGASATAPSGRLTCLACSMPG